MARTHSSEQEAQLQSGMEALQQQAVALQDELTARPQADELTR